MSLENVHQALIKQFNDTFGATWVNRLAWENTAFVASDGQPWMAFHFLPGPEQIGTLGEGGYDEVNGLVQIDVNYPIGIGESDLRETIDALRTCFRPGGLQFEGQTVTILSRGRAGGLPSDNFYKVPFTIRWRAHITR